MKYLDENESTLEKRSRLPTYYYSVVYGLSDNTISYNLKRQATINPHEICRVVKY